MCFKNLIEIYRKKLSREFDRLCGDYSLTNSSYIIEKYRMFDNNINKLLSLLESNVKDRKIGQKFRNSDKLFIDLYYKFNK